MKILVLSQTGDGLGVAQRMVLEGHQVAMWIKSKDYARSGVGIVERVAGWREKLRWADLVLVDMVGMGSALGVLQSVGVPFIGCHPLMDKLELERAAGMEVFARAGIAVPEGWSFGSPEEAHAFMKTVDWQDGFCIKADDNIGCATSRLVRDPDVLPWVFSTYPAGAALLVQRVVQGVEVSTEGWFNGRDWVRPFNHTFEEKRLMEGGLGPNTGCMGNVVITKESNRLTRGTVERLAPFLRRIGWKGPVDINCIVNETGAYALEATARLGYDAIEGLLEGVRLNAGEFFRTIAEGGAERLDITPDAMIVVRLTVPPYPLEDVPQAEWGEPILGINENNINHLWLCNVFVDRADMLFKTAPADGLVLKASARGEIKAGDYTSQCRDRVYRTLGNIRLGSKQYRLDIGRRVNGDMAKLVEWGWVQA